MDAVISAGVSFSSGRKPVTFAALDDDLKVVTLDQWTVSEAAACLDGYENALVALNVPNSKAGQIIHSELRKKIVHAGFKPFSKRESTRQWIESDADECYRVFQSGLLPRRSLEGRLQRALILYDQELKIGDPMDYFEEITRYKLIQGLLPTENIFSTKQVDALMMAYVAWLAVHHAEKVLLRGDLILPAPG
ncbi:MAG TPA: hypothetical protein VJ785_13310 [Anaerolineales bacterium]|nr:hypothetical protein [Anaerolineales bacterium]